MLIVLVHNDGTGTVERANYDYEIRVNDEVIERGHPRAIIEKTAGRP